MKLSTLAVPGSDQTTAAVQRGDEWVVVSGFADLGELLADLQWRRLAEEATTPAPADAVPQQLIRNPGKVLCVGLNYRNHILEMGRELPEYPTLFAKFAQTLTGPYADLAAPPEDPALDWEGELVVVIGARVRRADPQTAAQAIAGFSIANDISMRTWQFRTIEWLQGKIWEASTPIGPVLVTPDEFDRDSAELVTTVNDQVMQKHAIKDLLFGPEDLVSYVSTMITLEPGDVILTGTPGGVGRARDPQVFLRPGDTVSVQIDGIGQLRNRVVEDH